MRTVTSIGVRAGLGVAAALCALAALGQGAFEKELGDLASMERDIDFSMGNGVRDGDESGRGPVPYYRALGAPPKRVALLTFFVYDGGDEGIFVNTSTTTNGVQLVVNELYAAGFGPIKEAFAAVGMQLLTPDEFLDTPEKRKAYESFKLDSGVIGGLFRGAQRRNGLENNMAAAPGYNPIQIAMNGSLDTRDFRLAATGAGVGKIAQQLGYDLAKALGVDATVLVYNVTAPKRNAISLIGTYAYMFGPNPVAESGQSLYWQGHQYSGVWLKTDVPFITTDRDSNMVGNDFAGYALVARAIGNRMAAHLKEKTTGAP
jgi:hypothetical protein